MTNDIVGGRCGGQLSIVEVFMGGLLHLRQMAETLQRKCDTSGACDPDALCFHSSLILRTLAKFDNRLSACMSHLLCQIHEYNIDPCEIAANLL